MVERTSGIILPKWHPEAMTAMVNLDRYVRGWDDSSARMVFYEDLGPNILVPRFYPVSEEINDRSTYGDTIQIYSKIQPRNSRQTESMKWFQTQDHGILRLEPGSGKTVITIHAIATHMKKAIVFVHKDKLADQWKEEFITHTSLGENDISRLSTGSIDDDLKHPIIICTVQTILSMYRSQNKESLMWKLQNSGIGIAIFDECHVSIGPEQFSKVSMAINAKRVYGLSATPSRSDGNDDIMKYHLGEVTYYKPTASELLPPKVMMIYFPHKIFSAHTKYLMYGGKFNLSKYHQQMYKSDHYNYTVSKLIYKLYAKERNILVLGTRKNSLIEVAKQCDISNHDKGIFIPAADKKERLSVSDTDDLNEAFHEKRVVFATYGGARDGNNRKNLDALVMATSTTNIDQAVGRIQRALEGKPQPVVLDIVDTEGPEVRLSAEAASRLGKKVERWFLRSADKREQQYINNGWEIQKIYLQ